VWKVVGCKLSWIVPDSRKRLMEGIAGGGCAVAAIEKKASLLLCGRGLGHGCRSEFRDAAGKTKPAAIMRKIHLSIVDRVFVSYTVRPITVRPISSAESVNPGGIPLAPYFP